ncbi:glycosyltransferase [Dyadobacter frigoris]|uniref:Glycosyltransferase family 4 protein n=1 Tax=Dyadobacter frigoris TaxID=2576211 RepID=A0A4U6DAC3_9BACT|nr:glycosyltransferase [Dyadobacter frigoris]TKT93796.1 glycosyltransferase family 4 protein [Dyadobacter frigoris]GLU50990.1 glycosyl transferase [Dyadobacter frigoris]
MKPRVLLLSTVHPPTDPRIMYKIAPSLARDYEVICVLPKIINGLEKNAFETMSLPFFQSLLLRILFCHPVLLWKCLRFRPAIVHIFVPELIPVAFLFQWLGAKVIYEVQENLYKKFSIKRFNKAIIYQQLFKFFDQTARKNFNCLFTEHAYLNEYKNLPLTSAVVHNYVALPFIDRYFGKYERQIKQPPVFFYCGVISMERSFDVLVEALIKLKSRYPDFEMHLFGKLQFDMTDAEELPDFEEIRTNLFFHGYTDLKNALPYTRGATAGIALLKPVADYMDSYTTKIFEYMAVQLPVITSDFPLYRDVVEKSGCGFCISPYDSDNLAKKLEWLTENPEKAKVMGKNGRNSTETYFNWANEEQILLNFYRNLLKPKKSEF